MQIRQRWSRGCICHSYSQASPSLATATFNYRWPNTTAFFCFKLAGQQDRIDWSFSPPVELTKQCWNLLAWRIIACNFIAQRPFAGMTGQTCFLVTVHAGGVHDGKQFAGVFWFNTSTRTNNDKWKLGLIVLYAPKLVSF